VKEGVKPAGTSAVAPPAPPSVPPAAPPTVSSPQAVRPQTGAQEDEKSKRIAALMRELVSECSKLVFKVARCDCERRDECPVFRCAKRIAAIIDDLNEIRAE